VHELLGNPAATFNALGPRLLTAGYLCTMMFAMGLELGARPKEDKAGKRRQRRLLILGLAINLVLMPLLAVLLTRSLHAHGDVAIALLILMASPGGRFAPMLAKSARADLALSVELTLFLAKLTSFTAPPTVMWMLHSQHLDLPELRFIAQLVLLQFLPYLAGKLIFRHRPAWAESLAKPVRLASMTFLALILAFLVAHREMRSLVLIGARGWLAALTMAGATLGIGWLLGGRTAATRRSMAIGVNARDGALALFIGTLAFPQGGVQIAMVGEWLIFLVCNAAFAALIGRRTMGSRLPPHAARAT
jgi:bile acid:Na+ symporter, BASS family